MKFPSDKSFFEFLGTKPMSRVWILLIIAIVLLLVPSIGRSDEEIDSLETRTAELCSAVEGVGECRVMITYRDESEVYAVAVVCQGADSLSVRRDITELISSLYGIGSNRVEILRLR